MEKEILTIDGHIVDIIPNEVNRHLQVNKLGEIKNRQANYSNTVKLPITDNNKKVFDFLGVGGSTSRSPYKALPCTYTVDGIPLIRKGTAVVQSTTEHYEVVLYDGLIGLKEALKDKNINDLNLKGYNHYLFPESFKESLTKTFGYVYGMAYFDTANSVLEIERQAPSLFVHNIWDKIFNESGIKYKGDFFKNNADFKKEVISPVKGYNIEKYGANLVQTLQSDTKINNQTSPDPIKITEDFIFPTTANSVFEVGANGKVVFKTATDISLLINVGFTSITGKAYVIGYYNGEELLKYPVSELSTFTTYVGFKTAVNDELYFEFVVESEETTAPYEVDYNIALTMNVDKVTQGNLIDFNNIMPEVSQSDFIKDIITRYGLLVDYDAVTDVYEFTELDKLFGDFTNAEDWSDKLVSIKKEKYGSSDFAKKNTLVYEHDYEGSKVGNGFFEVDNENLKGEKEFYKSPYSIPIGKYHLKFGNIYKNYIWDFVDVGQYEIADDTTPKIFSLRYFKIPGEDLFFDYFGDDALTYIGDMPILSLNNLSMQYFLDNYYQNYITTVNNYKEVEADLYLTPIDLYNLDFFKLKYFKQTGKYYYLNKVETKGKGLSEVKLIEITPTL